MDFPGVFSRIGREVARSVMPSWCVVCERELPWRDRVASCCGACWAALPRIDGAKCLSCARPLPGDGEIRCLECQIDPAPLDWCDAWGRYAAGLESLVHAFKFGRHDFLADPLASLMEETLLVRGDLEFDAVAAVPMSRTKRRRRGYNQAELLGRELARRTGLAFEPRLLRKTAERETQSTLPRERRAANVRGVFRASERAEGKAVLLVDDICTTGQTLRACARELARTGASRACALALAKVT